MSFDLNRWAAKHGLTITDDEDVDPVWAWVDIETTGLDPDTNVILEFGLVMTDAWGTVLRDSHYHSLVWQDTQQYKDSLEAMIPMVREMHTKSGLLADLKSSTTRTPATVEADLMLLLSDFGVASKELNVAGNSVHYDMSFMHRYLFNLEQFLHYRQNNVSTLKILCQKLNPTLHGNITKHLSPFMMHRSMSDLGDSINEFKCYADNFLWT